MDFLVYIREFKKDLLNRENIFFFLFILAIFFIDRVSKNIIISNFSESSYFVNDYINLDLIWNIGIGFGILSTQSTLIYSAISTIIFIIILILIFTLVKSKILDKMIYSIIIGGALGNFYDRLKFNAVPDFIDMHYNDFHWFTFNVADIFITIGILTFIIRSFFEKNY